MTVVDSHTAGMPTRTVTGGVQNVPGDTMGDKRAWASSHLLDTIGLLCREPRGHTAMFGALLQPATREDADIGILYFDAADFIPMCGHGTIGAVTVLLETGILPVTGPVVDLRLDTAAGLVSARAQVHLGAVTSVTITNVPAFVIAHDQHVLIPSVGDVLYDLVWGGNLYPIVRVEDAGLSLDADNSGRLLEIGLQIIKAINASAPPAHPLDPTIHGTHSMMWVTTDAVGADSRIATINLPGYIDRSPCGTGTSALMALRHAQGILALEEHYINESPIGTRFSGELIAQTEIAGLPAVVPTITGQAWITGYTDFVLREDDPFPRGFTL